MNKKIGYSHRVQKARRGRPHASRWLVMAALTAVTVLGRPRAFAQSVMPSSSVPASGGVASGSRDGDAIPTAAPVPGPAARAPGARAAASASEAPGIASGLRARQASPWGTSPYVVAYQPPSVRSRVRRGLTLEVFAGTGAGSNGLTATQLGAGGFAIGGWVSRRIALTFRMQGTGELNGPGVAVQYTLRPRTWVGAGISMLSRRTTYEEYVRTGESKIVASGFHVRSGCNLYESGRNAMYAAIDLTGIAFDGELYGAAAVLLGYQLL